MSALPTSKSAAHTFRTLLRDERLREQFFPPLTDAECSAVERLLPFIWDSASQWMARYPFLNADALLPATILKIAQMPKLGATDVGTSVQWELWVYAADDLFDEGQTSFDELRAIAEECHGIALARPGSERPTSPFGSALADIKGQLARHPSFGAFHPAFVGGLLRLLDGFFYAYGVQSFDPTLSFARIHFQDYLYRASWTLIHPFMWCLPLYDDESVLLNLPVLSQLGEQCSRALRLANDLATWDRETDEGSLNAVALKAAHLARDGCGSADEDRFGQAIREVTACLACERGRVYELAARVSTSSGVEAGFVRLMELGADMYQRRDLREWRKLVDHDRPASS